MSTTSMNIAGVFDSRCRVRLSVEAQPADLRQFDGKATLSFSTGAVNLQTYLTPAECEEMSSMLLLAAKEAREQVGEMVAA